MLKRSSHVSEIHLKDLSNHGLMSIATHCGPSLRTIKAKVGSESRVPLESICQACPNLVALRLTFSGFFLNIDVIIPAIVQYCHLIEVLPTGRITDISLDSLAALHSLKELKLLRDNCTSAAVQRVLQSNTHITDIDLKGTLVDNALVRCIGRCCGNLICLRLLKDSSEQATPLSDSALLGLFQGCPLLKSFRLKQGDRFSQVALRALFENCRNLTALEVDIYALIEDLSVGEPILYTHYPTLTQLTVYGDGVTASALRDIFTYCINLREVSIQECDPVTDEPVITLAQRSRSLDTLDLSRCKNVTIAGVMEVATHCSSLNVLKLSLMPVNDGVLIRLSLHCPRLESLSIIHSDESITEAGLLAIAEGCTGLTFLTIRCNMGEAFAPYLDLTKLRQLYPHITLTSIKSTSR